MGIIICLTGPDGSGKSTVARELALELSRRGFRVRVSWMRGSHTIASLIARFLSRFPVFRGRGNPYYGISIPGSLRPLWWFLEFISAIPIILTRYSLPALLGYVVIGDRCALDLVVWVSMTTGDSAFIRSILGKALISIAMRSNVIVYVTADYKVLRVRRGADWGLREQLGIYNALSRVLDLAVLDTTNVTVTEARDKLLSIVSGTMDKNRV
ncbi:hypothetical protein [Vulcanisaeta thermophila]|uniref:hypothetical protein n=1 Tax=Vulcanisaeta thermophila TaxID=867917 RepID=UPI00085373D6|nr:hypothetical protein [Vulcanisaeta thermophila]